MLSARSGSDAETEETLDREGAFAMAWAYDRVCPPRVRCFGARRGRVWGAKSRPAAVTWPFAYGLERS